MGVWIIKCSKDIPKYDLRYMKENRVSRLISYFLNISNKSMNKIIFLAKNNVYKINKASKIKMRKDLFVNA